MLDKAHIHSQQHHYKFNPPKSAVVVLGSAPLPHSMPDEWKMGADPIRRMNSYRYLGVQTSQEDSTFQGFARTLPARARLAVAPFKQTASVLSRLAPPRVARMVLMAHVVPHLEYGVSALPLTPKSMSSLDTAFRTQVKLLLGASPAVRWWTLFADFGLQPISYRRQQQLLILFHRLCEFPDQHSHSAVLLDWSLISSIDKNSQ